MFNYRDMTNLQNRFHIRRRLRIRELQSRHTEQYFAQGDDKELGKLPEDADLVGPNHFSDFGFFIVKIQNMDSSGFSKKIPETTALSMVQAIEWLTSDGYKVKYSIWSNFYRNEWRSVGCWWLRVEHWVLRPVRVVSQPWAIPFHPRPRLCCPSTGNHPRAKQSSSFDRCKLYQVYMETVPSKLCNLSCVSSRIQ